MPDVHIARHGDRWAVKESHDATPIFESLTFEEAEAEARRLAAGGTVHVSDEPDQEAVGREDPEAAAGTGGEDRPLHGSPKRPGEEIRETQSGL